MIDKVNQLEINAKRIIVDRISNPLYLPKHLIGYENEIKIICEKLDDAIIRKKSISCLVNGPRSSGKTMLIRYCLSKYNKDEFISVEFSAVTHFNDNLAFKEIAKALKIEVERGISIYDTIDLIKQSLGLTQEDYSSNTESSNLKRKKLQHLPVIVIINELDEILKNSSKQNLLYNILDLAHYKGTSISFIGTSSHHEIYDLLEKRIKSRFTQEMILIPKLSYNNIINILISLLSIPSSHNIKENRYIETWNNSVVSVFNDENVLSSLNKKYYQLYTRVPYYHNLILEILDLINEDNQFITNKIILSAINNKTDPIISMISRLTPMEFTILGCLSKIPNCQDNYISFNDLYYGEYKKYSESYYKTSDIVNKSTAIKVIQDLSSLGIIKSQNRTEIGEYNKIKISISLESIRESAINNKSLPSSLVKYITEWLQ